LVLASVETGSSLAPELSITSGGLPPLKRGCSCGVISVVPVCLIAEAENFSLYSDSWNFA
jgi:hypothetical protein